MHPKPVINDVLADRYASTAMVTLWSPERRIVLERQLWIAVLKAQISLGVSAPQEAVGAYEAVIDQIDFDSMRVREQESRHDVKAHLDEFCALAGYEVIHRGMTSRDVTDNVEQMVIKDSLTLARDRLVAILARLAKRADEYRSLVMAGRSHNVAAQATTVGKRFANVGEETYLGFVRLNTLLGRYPLRGIKGPMGTSQDQLELLGGDHDKLAKLESKVARHLGFNNVLSCVGQVYPRSLDYEVLTALAQAASGIANMATTLRLMAGFELATEGFKEGQVGSSAMPHKMNSRSSERINSLLKVILGFADMVSRLLGDQWQEGDVSCSVVRRVVLPGAFFAFDGLVETALTVLDELGFYPAVIKREFERYSPFLSTTRILTGAVAKGRGRETVHAAIKQHAKAVALEMRNTGLDHNDLFHRLSEDERLGLSEEEIHTLVGDPSIHIGNAGSQVSTFWSQVGQLVEAYPEAANYNPEPIL